MEVSVYGGDITGLVVARILRDAGHSVRVYERDVPGRSALIPRFKYLERSKEVQTFLDALGMIYGEYSIVSGVILHGEVVPVRKNLTPSVQHAYWRKTRLISSPGGEVKGVTDPEVGPRRQALSLDWGDLRKPLLQGADITGDPLTGRPPDLHVETRPLWESLFISRTDAMATTLNLIPVKSVRDRYVRWDLVYTPFTPADYIHRVYHYGDGYVCECSGELDEERMTSDLNFLFPEGWHVDGDIHHAHGHLLPLIDRPVWPDNVRPIGRLALWDERVTLTHVIRDAMAIAGNGNP